MTPLLRLLALVGWSCIIAPIQLTALFLNGTAARRVPVTYHRVVLWIFGISITTEGEMRQQRPTLFVGNHISYLDIFVLGAMIEGCFVAKAEIATWPVAGFFAKLQRTIFVQRDRRASAGAQRDMLHQRLEEGGNVILFPEGTSYDGVRVLPFKSALFSAAERKVGGHPVTVQPVSIAYVTMDGLPLTRAQRPTVAWYGDMGLLPHIWTFLSARRTQVALRFHPPVSMEDHVNRRQLAAACQAVIADGVTSMVSGRESQPRLTAPAPSVQSA